MARSDELIRERSEYYAFKEQIANLIVKIAKAIDSYNSPKNRIYDMYQINSENGDYGRIQNDQSQLKSVVSNLSDNTIPAIQSKIDQLSSEIQAALQAEEEERRRQEEEAEKAAQEAAAASSSTSN